MSSITIRKKNANTSDIELAEVEPLTSSTSIVSNDSNNGKTTTRINKVLIIIVIVLFTIIFSSPADKKKNRKQINDKQLEKLSDSIKNKKLALSKKYNELTSEINFDVKSLGIVSKGYHEEKVSTLQSDHKDEIGNLRKDHEEEVNKLKESHETKAGQLQSDVTEKQTTIDALNAEIENDKKELQNVKSLLDGIEIDITLFCGECAFTALEGLRVSCGARMGFLVSKYGGTEDDMKEAVIKTDPKCKKNKG